jgi:vacuolar-type H+-ATPase subunit C/Vma6
VYDYGNARIAANRSRLLGRDAARLLQAARTPSAMLTVLERFDDWRPIVAEVLSLGAPPAQAIDAAIERHRSRRLAPLVTWYPPPVRGLVEALVMFLDGERLVAILRRRRAGESPDRIGTSVAPGALLDAEGIGFLARAPSDGVVLGRAAAAGLLARNDAMAIARLVETGKATEEIEAALVTALDAARCARATDPRGDARRVAAIIEDEIEARDRAVAQAATDGVGVASLAERDATLARLDLLARLGRRDPLGIGAVAGYVAAVEAGTIRMRATLAGAVAGWPASLVGEYFVPGSAERSAMANQD